MVCHPSYLDDPWDIQWHHEAGRYDRHLWGLVAMLVCLAVFLIGVSVTSGFM